jgi:5-formyltetrahydrofolate cyclo-ligase
MTQQQRQQQSHAIAHHLATFPLFQIAKIVASYESWDSEPATTEINAALLERGAKVMVPAGGLTPGWRWLGAATSGSTVLPPETLHDAELIILPALRIDSQGNRLGRGGGWYDRMLPHRNEGRSAPGYDGFIPRAVMVALLFDGELQHENPLPAQTHDIAVDYVATPNGIIGPLNRV